MGNSARRWIGWVLGAGLLVACTAENPPPSPVSRDPPPFPGFIVGGNIQRTGVYPGQGSPYFGDELWRYQAAGNNTADAGVVVAQGLAFVNGGDQGLLAIDCRTGRLQYTLDDGEGLPTVADGVVYYAARDGLHAWNLATHKDHWVFPAAGIGESPLVDQGVVYATVGTNRYRMGGDNGALVALDAQTGHEKWRFHAGNLGIPALGDGRIYVVGGTTIWRADVADFQGTLYAVDAQTGREAWHVVAPSTSEMAGSFGDPIYDSGRMYTTTDFNAFIGPGHVYAFDARNGQEIWKQTTADQLTHPSTPLVYHGTLYVGTQVPSELGRPGIARLYALDTQTGGQKWMFEAGEGLSEPAIAQGTLYVAAVWRGNRSALYALDANTGNQRAIKNFAEILSGRLTPVDGTIYLAGGRERAMLLAVSTQAAPAPPETTPQATPSP